MDLFDFFEEVFKIGKNLVSCFTGEEISDNNRIKINEYISQWENKYCNDSGYATSSMIKHLAEGGRDIEELIAMQKVLKNHGMTSSEIGQAVSEYRNR